MNFSGKIIRLLIGTVSLSLTANAFLLEARASRFSPTIPQLAQVLTPEEINLRAKQTIVRIDGASVGSGSIIEYADQVYTVLTNWHVMKNEGEYTVQTIDGRKHQVDLNSIKRLPGLDLAILEFTSNQNYQTSETGDSANLNEGQSIYFAGYPGELRREDNRYYRFFTANLVGILPKSTENGYSLIYNGEAFPGMSGGPVFNQQGLMIGIHGEANVHALSGGTSNYAIPINSYKSAIAELNTPTNPTKEEPEAVAAKPTEPRSNSQNNPDSIEPNSKPKNTPNTANPSETNSKLEVESSVSSGVNNQSSSEISSVPTFSAKPDSISQTETEEASKTNPEPAQSSETDSREDVATAKPELEEPVTKPVTETNSDDSTTSKTPSKNPLISRKTGIDYTKLQNLLKEKQWSQADIHTYKLVEQIVKTAKQQNRHTFIELKTIAKFSCPDIRTIDDLWQEYSGNKFGFSSQQDIWQSVNQKGDFSTQTWRKFATKVGWKTGEVDSSSGYLLYEELDFDPTAAPSGHLPWWFALPEEEQNVIKQLFSRCNLNPSSEELAAEAKPDKDNQTPQSEVDNSNKPNLNKAPKQN